jgi:hypothetical protein
LPSARISTSSLTTNCTSASSPRPASARANCYVCSKASSPATAHGARRATVKLEGIAATVRGSTIHLLLVDDPDDPAIAAQLYAATLLSQK